MNQRRTMAAVSLLVLLGGLLLFASPQVATKEKAPTQPAPKTKPKTVAKHKKAAPAPNVVLVYHDDCSVNAPSLILHKHLLETVHWKYAESSNDKATIEFVKGPDGADKTPCFQAGNPVYQFFVQGSHFSATCHLDDQKTVYGSYKYTVKVENGCTGPDPSVDVQN